MSVEGPALEPPRDNPYDRIVAQTREQRRLLSVHWELTYSCNERCSHCYLDVLAPSQAEPRLLTTRECQHVIDELAALGVLNLSFSGGEILTRGDFFQIAEYAHSKRFLLRLFTNGIQITPTVADRIAALHPYAVEISLYSTQPEVHEQITRIPGSFGLTARALRLLHERGVRTVIKTPLMRENVRELDALKAIAAELGAQFRYDITVTPKDNGSLTPLAHRLTDDDLLWLFRQNPDPAFWLARKDAPDGRTCQIARNALVIDPYGNVSPCVQVRTSAGNVRRQSVETIWKESPLWAEMHALVISEFPQCRVCELRRFCVRCHGLAFVEDGDIRGPASINCRQAFLRRQVLVEQGALPAPLPAAIRLQDELAPL